MASRDFRRRAVTAAALYGGTAAGILGTLIAVRVLGPDQFGLLTIALAAAGFVQLLLDTTVEEAIVKYGIRYAATDDWGRLRGLFRAGIAIKWGGGALATLVILALVPFADALFDEPGLTAPLVVAAFIPVAQAPEGIAGAAMIVAGRYDLRAIFGGLAMVCRLVGVAVGVQYGVTWAVVGILVGQIVGSCASGLAGHRLFSRHPAAAVTGLRRDRAELARFVLKSGIGTSLVSMRNTLSPLVLGVVASATQVGYFRAAQAPITAFEALSAPGPTHPPDRADARRRARPDRRDLSLAASVRRRRDRRCAGPRPDRLGADAVARARRARRPTTSRPRMPPGSSCWPQRCGSCSAGPSRFPSRSASPACGSSRTRSRSQCSCL